MTFSVPLLVSLVVVAVLTAAGMAIRSVSRIWLRHWAELQLRGSAAAITYLERPHRLLTAANVGVALTLLVAGLFIGAAEHGTAKVAWSTLAFAGFVIVAGQLVPRAIARRWPSVIAPIVLPILRLTDLVATPIVVVGRVIAGLFVKEETPSAPAAERDAIQDLLREGELEGVGHRDEIAIISGVVQFSGKVVSSVMTPRAEIFALEKGVDPHTLAAQIAQTHYSRVPIYDGSLDQVIGMVHAFDVLKSHGEMPERIRPVAFSAANAFCNELLFRMLRERLHLAIVQDAGHTVGLVTLEDLLEELVGDIRDEHDEPEPPRVAR